MLFSSVITEATYKTTLQVIRRIQGRGRMGGSISVTDKDTQTPTNTHAHTHAHTYTRNHIDTQKLLCVSSVVLRQMHHVSKLYKLVSCSRTVKNKRKVNHILLIQNANQHLLPLADQIILPTVNNLSPSLSKQVLM